MTRTFRYDKRLGKVVEVTAEARPRPAGPYIQGDLPGYMSPLGEKGHWVEGRRARREDMARHDVREVEPSERPKGIGIPKTQAQADAEKAQLRGREPYTMSPEMKAKLMRGH